MPPRGACVVMLGGESSSVGAGTPVEPMSCLAPSMLPPTGPYRTMPRSAESPRTVRIAGALLAAIWLCAGAAAITLGVVARRWLLVLLGVAALWYGVAWLNVARLGRRLTVREALEPWRIGRASNRKS